MCRVPGGSAPSEGIFSPSYPLAEALRPGGPGSLRARRPPPRPRPRARRGAAGATCRPRAPPLTARRGRLGPSRAQGRRHASPSSLLFPFPLGIKTVHRLAATRACRLPGRRRRLLGTGDVRCGQQPSESAPSKALFSATEQSELLLSRDLLFYLKCTFIT